jgi:hypothetical protein
MRREIRIEKMEGVAHPLDWMAFRMGPGGIEMLQDERLDPPVERSGKGPV